MEHHSHVAFLRRQYLPWPGYNSPANLHRAGVRRFKAGYQAQCRGLAAAAGAQQRKRLALGKLQVEAVDGPDLAEGLGEARASDRYPVQSPLLSRRITRNAIGAEDTAISSSPPTAAWAK